MSFSVLVTGGAGYIGSHACKALAKAGYQPVCYDDLSHGHRRAVRWGPLVEGSIADAACLDQAFARYRPRVIMHFAGLMVAGESVREPARYYRNNVVGTLTLLEAMRRHGVDRIVFSSTAAVYGIPRELPMTEAHPTNPINPYGSSKLACERMLQDFAAAYGLRSIAFRYFNAAGADPDGETGEDHMPETHLVPLVLEAAAGQRPFVPVFGNTYPTRDGTCLRDYIHVCDLAQAHVLGLRRLQSSAGAAVFNLGNGEGFTVLEVVEAARRVTGAPIPLRIEPPRPGDPPSLLADSRLARAELGWRPDYPELEVQLRHAWNWRLQEKSRAASGR